jgi:AbrB family transcriptional regulator (stage V sporulation protein T)
MKATGIVRRIDDLGRVVIPKEIRRTMRIREGDPLEIYTDKDGEVIFKKYSLMGGLTDFAAQMCETLNKTTGHVCVITDRDACIAVSGAPRRELLDKRLGEGLERVLEGRKIYQHQPGETPMPVSDEGGKLMVSCAAPILAEGDVLGCVLFAAEEGDLTASETDYKLLQTMSGFLGRHMES